MENLEKEFNQKENINEYYETKWKQLITILDNMNDIICLYNNQGKIIFANKKAYTIFNKRNLNDPNSAVLAYKYYDEAGNELPFEKLPIAKALKGEKTSSTIIKSVFKEIVAYVSISAVPIFSEKGTLDFVVVINQDITQDYLSKKQMVQKNKELEVIIENIPDALAIFDNKGNLVKLNAEARIMYPDLFLKNTVANVHEDYEYFDLENNPIALENLPTRRAMNGEKIRNERLIIKGLGKNQITEINAAPVTDNDNNLLSVVITHRDITEKINNQNKLLNTEVEKRKALESAMKFKDEFLYLITHEFRTPIAVINSALQAIELMYDEEVTVNVRKHLNKIKQNNNRQLRLVNNLLDITKMNSGNIKLNNKTIDIVFLTKAIVNSVEFYVKQKGVHLNFITSTPSELVYLDEEKYERIMLNLLSNALKFTPKGNHINVTLSVRKSKKQKYLYVIVKDEGIGIPKEKHRVIFERFEQVDSSLSRQTEGTGLGLYLVKLLVDALDGKISLESEEGKGSSFAIILPLVTPAIVEEVSTCNNINNQFLSADNRILQSTSVEFSDIYFD